MRCIVCKFGETELGATTYNLNLDAMTLVVKNVPASVCDACGEGYLELEVSARLQEIVDDAKTGGVDVLICKYTPATVPLEANGTQREPVREFIDKLGLATEQFVMKEHSNGYRLYINMPAKRQPRFGFVRLNTTGDFAGMLVVYANGDFRDPERRFQCQPKNPKDGFYRFSPSDESAMSYVACVVRSAYDSRRRD